MNCPTCGTANNPASRFCIKCGRPLAEAAGATPLAPTRPALNTWAVFTIQALTALLLIWLTRLILLRLPFTQSIRLPRDVPLTMNEIMSSLAYGLALIVLVLYAQAVWAFWSRTFPRSAFLTPALAALVYVAALVALYFALARPLLVFTEEPDLVLAFQVVLLVMALLLLGWALVVIYRFIPIGLSGLMLDIPTMVFTETPCAHCGQWNPVQMKFCGHCGRSLTQPVVETPRAG